MSTGNPASYTALNTVVATWQMPPPMASSYSPSTMAPAPSKPRSSVLQSPAVPLNDQLSPGFATESLRYWDTSAMLWLRASVPGPVAYSVV